MTLYCKLFIAVEAAWLPAALLDFIRFEEERFEEFARAGGDLYLEKLLLVPLISRSLNILAYETILPSDVIAGLGLLYWFIFVLY